MFLSKPAKHKALPSTGLEWGAAPTAGSQVLAGSFAVGFKSISTLQLKTRVEFLDGSSQRSSRLSISDSGKYFLELTVFLVRKSAHLGKFPKFQTISHTRKYVKSGKSQRAAAAPGFTRNG